MEWLGWALGIAGTILGAIGVDIYAHLKSKSKKAIEERKEKRDEELREVVREELKPVRSDIKEVKDDLLGIKNGEIVLLAKANRDALRNQLFTLYNHCHKQGYKTFQDEENWAEMFDSYKTLGGNHTVDDYNKKFNSMPTEAEYRRDLNQQFTEGLH